MYSFDIFDTLLTRTTATPKGIFALIQNRLQEDKNYGDISSHVRNNFFALRIHAERLARDNFYSTEIRDITLEQIYQAFNMVGSMTPEQLERLIKLELMTEAGNSVGIEENLNQVRRLVGEGKHVVLISDMYLPVAFIREMLVKADPVFGELPIYVSSQYRVTKAEGGLYDKVRTMEKENLKKDGGQWVHCGDNTQADVAVAAAKGIETEWYSLESLLPVEEQMLQRRENDPVCQLVIGSARNARNARSARNKDNVCLGGTSAWKEHRAYRMGCGIGGPMLFAYVNWVIRESQEKGIRDLYFVARDGFVLKRMADQILAEKNITIDTHYFYGSRQAWRMPSIQMESFELDAILKWSYTSKIDDLEGIARLFGMDPEMLAPFIPAAKGLWNKKFTQETVNEIIQQLCSMQEFKEVFCRFQEEKRIKIQDYVRQEIGDRREFAFVELSGTGTTQDCLAGICQELFPDPIQTFYLKKDRFRSDERGKSLVWFMDTRQRSYMIEELCRAPHGQTVGYQREGNTIQPILMNDEAEQLIAHGFQDYLEGVLAFVAAQVKALKGNQKTQDFNLELWDRADLFADYLHYISHTPDSEVRDFFGDMPFNLTGREETESVFAPKLTQDQIQKIYLTRQEEPLERFFQGSSLEYSLYRCSKEERDLIARYQRENETGKGFRPRNSENKAGWGPDYEYADAYDFIARRPVIFGAGKRGKLLYEQLQQAGGYEIQGWLDSGYSERQTEGLQVDCPEKIKELSYDQVVIAVLDEAIVGEIRKQLREYGVLEHKILAIKPRKFPEKE